MFICWRYLTILNAEMADNSMFVFCHKCMQDFVSCNAFILKFKSLFVTFIGPSAKENNLLPLYASKVQLLHMC